MELEITGTQLMESGRLNPQNTGLINLSELNRMKMNLSNRKFASKKEEDRNRLKEISSNRIKHWPNTVTALRNKKETDRFEKFQKEEQERRRVEKEEAAYQNNEKRKLLQKAKLDIFRRHDKVKKLHSTMLMSDVLKERDLQQAIKTHKEGVSKEIEANHHLQILEQIRKQEVEATRRAQVRQKKKEEQQKVLKKQKGQFREKYIHRMREQILEGEIIKAQAAQAVLDAKKEEQERYRKIIAAQEETRQANDVLKQIREQEKLKELEEEERIEAYAKSKENRIRKRKEEELRKFEEKQAIKQKMIDKAVADLQKKQDHEEFLLERDIERENARKERDRQAKLAKARKRQANIEKHRLNTQVKRRTAKDAEAAEDKDFQGFWNNKNKNIEQRIKKDKQDRRNMNRALYDFQQSQAAEKQHEREMELMKEMEQADQINEAIIKDEKMFRTYAERCVKEWESNVSLKSC